MAYGQDAVFSEDALVTRINADLANNLGNLVSRTLSMQHRYFDGLVQPLDEATADDRDLIAACAAAVAEAPPYIQDLAFHRALEAIWRAIDHANKYIVVTAPFTLAKNEAQRPRVGAILHNLLEALRVTAVLLQAALPETSARILRLLGREGDGARVVSDLEWGAHFAAGHRVGKPEALFPRIEIPPAA
jgi:methionyl-tRNA synthetase